MSFNEVSYNLCQSIMPDLFLKRLEINQFRNLNQVILEPNASHNVFFGDNGSGKTSLLEAIYYLSLARSFRSRQNAHIIQYGKEHLTIFGELSENDRLIPLGVRRDINGKRTIRMAESVTTIDWLAQTLPVQLINHDANRLLTTSRCRRRGLDWGVFHVEHSFLEYWRHYHQALKQRNAAIRNHLDAHRVHIWNETLCENAQMMDNLRRNYIEQLEPIFLDICHRLIGCAGLKVRYYRGWALDKSLGSFLEDNYLRDIKLGYTQYGPQRADLVFRMDNNFAIQDVLSHGQQKLLVYAFKLAQGLLLNEKMRKHCIYLVDDLPAELDQNKRVQVAEQLNNLGAQVFVVGVLRDDLQCFSRFSETVLFHVKHGCVMESKWSQ